MWSVVRSRAACTRAPWAPAGDLFKERTIEMEERSEEAMVSKEARVKEELVVKKDLEQRTETISDTVRSTKVEVEDERGNRITGTTGTSTDRDRR
jgi:stress response protein YsnF